MLATCLARAECLSCRSGLRAFALAALGRIAACFVSACLVVDHSADAAEAYEAARLVLVFIGTPSAAYHALGVFP